MNFFYSFFSENLLLLHGDIEANPGPNKKYKSFTCCHWNVNSFAANNMLKLSSIAAYNSIHKYDFICISETYLDSSVQSDDRDISINGYNLIRADLPSNNKRGGVCIYYRESLAVQLVKTNYLNQCLLCEISFNNEKVTLQSYIDPPAKIDWSLILLFQILKRCLVIFTLNPDFVIILGDLMIGPTSGRLVIPKHMKAHKLFSHSFLWS